MPRDRCRLLFAGIDWVRKGGDTALHLSRSNEQGASALNCLFKTSHFLIMPTRAEAFGLVFAEANAFALPSLATNVGGIPEVVRCGVNGATFPLSSEPAEYCTFIANLMLHYDEYEELALSAFSEFETRLNNRTAQLWMRCST
jgi:glycosyltransferase involved in cell wall biosynthesis